MTGALAFAQGGPHIPEKAATDASESVSQPDLRNPVADCNFWHVSKKLSVYNDQIAPVNHMFFGMIDFPAGIEYHKADYWLLAIAARLIPPLQSYYGVPAGSSLGRAEVAQNDQCLDDMEAFLVLPRQTSILPALVRHVIT